MWNSCSQNVNRLMVSSSNSSSSSGGGGGGDSGGGSCGRGGGVRSDCGGRFWDLYACADAYVGVCIGIGSICWVPV